MELATIASALAPVALLACPVGMGVMTWTVRRGKKQRPEAAAQLSHPASLEVLGEEQRRLGTEIARLESDERPGVGSAT